MFLKNSFQKIYNIKKLLCIAFSALIFTFAVSAQVDPTFAPVPSNLTSFSGGFSFQPDGKILVYGGFQIIQGVQKNGIARLNADGSLDNSFTCTICDWSVGSAVVQPDGKIIIAGAKYETVSGNRLRRLNADGSIDSSFTSPFAEGQDGFNPSSHVWTLLPDGKMYVSQHFSFMGDPWSYLYRLNANGSIDSSFTRLLFSYGIGQFGQKHFLGNLKLLPDGKLMIGGKHDYGFLFRINPDGSKDNSFVSPVLSSIFTNPTLGVTSFDIQADGKIPLLGYFGIINGVSKEAFARLNSDQSLETSYTFPLPLGSTSQGRKLELLSDGKLLVSGPITGKIVRLNTDGSLDGGFNAPANLTTINGWRLDASERILVSASFSNGGTQLARLNADGSRDETFNVTFGSPPSRIYASAVQPDGKIIFTGGFRFVDNVDRQGMARLNPDGTLDTTFDAGTAFNRDVYDLVVQPDGKILAQGVFTTFNGTPRDSFARVNADGSLDAAFNPTVQPVYAVAVHPDSKILIAGEFTTVNGTARTGLARLNPDGSLDNSFNPILTGSPIAPLALLVQADGKIMVGGYFTTINGVARQYLARLNADGTLDTSFDAAGIPFVRILTRQADGKYLTSDRNRIYRRNPDGSADASFQSINFDNQSQIYAFLAQSDGTILVSGGFTQVGNDLTKKYLVRLAANGTLMPDFLPGGVNERVNTLSKQSNNKVIVGGDFTSIGGLTRFGIARLDYTPVERSALFDFDGDGKADVSVFRPSENRWYVLRSSDFGVTQQVFAIPGDVPVPADYDGDGKTDFAIFRPSSGDWWSLSSLNGNQVFAHWGQNGDIPRPSDFDGDGRADYVVFRPSNNFWYRISSANGAASNQAFGLAGDKPVIADFDGDGKSDKAIYRPSTGDWWWQSSVDNVQRATHWGISTDIPSPADFDGDGKTDFAVYRPSTGIWYIFNSSDFSATIINFGLAEDKPVAADYDGDGKADIAVFRPSTGAWYIMQTTAGFWGAYWGISTDIPTENAFVP